MRRLSAQIYFPADPDVSVDACAAFDSGRSDSEPPIRYPDSGSAAAEFGVSRASQILLC